MANSTMGKMQFLSVLEKKKRDGRCCEDESSTGGIG